MLCHMAIHGTHDVAWYHMMSLCTGPREHAAVLAAPPHGQTSCLLPGFTHFTRFTRFTRSDSSNAAGVPWASLRNRYWTKSFSAMNLNKSKWSMTCTFQRPLGKLELQVEHGLFLLNSLSTCFVLSQLFLSKSRSSESILGRGQLWEAYSLPWHAQVICSCFILQNLQSPGQCDNTHLRFMCIYIYHMRSFWWGLC